MAIDSEQFMPKVDSHKVQSEPEGRVLKLAEQLEALLHRYYWLRKINSDLSKQSIETAWQSAGMEDCSEPTKARVDLFLSELCRLGQASNFDRANRELIVLNFQIENIVREIEQSPSLAECDHKVKDLLRIFRRANAA
jgi:hypothetical protein